MVVKGTRALCGSVVEFSAENGVENTVDGDLDCNVERYVIRDFESEAQRAGQSGTEQQVESDQRGVVRALTTKELFH